MKKIVAVLLFAIIPALIISCSKTKQMNPDDFIKIQNEFLSSDQTENSKESIAKKYGFSAKDYDEFDKKVESDPALKAKLGEIRLKNPSDRK